MITDYLGEGLPTITKSEVESRRFERSVARLSIPLHSKLSDSELVTLAGSVDVDLLILRSPTTRNRLGGMLGANPDIQTIHADTLLYFSRELEGSHGKFQHSDGFSVSTEPIPPDELRDLILATFADYQNHYSANPDLPNGAVQDGYAEWAFNTLTSEDGHLVTLRNRERVVSFIVYSLFRQNGGEVHAEVLLNGTHPLFRNLGLYRVAFQGSLADAARRGARRMWISTQSSHRAMIRTWERAGLRFEIGLNTYHCSPHQFREGRVNSLASDNRS